MDSGYYSPYFERIVMINYEAVKWVILIILVSTFGIHLIGSIINRLFHMGENTIFPIWLLGMISIGAVLFCYGILVLLYMVGLYLINAGYAFPF